MKSADHQQPAATPYIEELLRHRRVLGAVCTGMAAGWLLNHYVANLFAPHLIEEFGWSRSDFALIGSLGIIALFVVPVIGRLTDIIGVRPVAAVGVASFPLSFVAFSLMSGSIVVFAAITMLQTLLAGATTGSTVYSRLIAERFVAARGSALALAATSPALVGVIASPFLASLIEREGWRAGYLAVAAYTALVGCFALILMPPGRSPDRNAQAAPAKRSAKKDYGTILRTPALWVIGGGFLLCNLIYPLQSSQMNLMLIENGASTQAAASMISLFAAGVMIGRFVCGFALDRFPAPIVAAVALGLPSLGLLAMGLGFNGTAVLAASVMVMGLSLGAESDLAAYLVIRYFKIDVYGTVLGLVVSALALSAVLGALLLGLTLRLVDHFSLYMLIAAVLCGAGAMLFLLLGHERVSGHAGRGEAEAMEAAAAS